MVSRPELGSDPSFGSCRESGRDTACLRSQPGLEVATWPRLLGHLVSRPGLWVATGAGAAVRSSARD